MEGEGVGALGICKDPLGREYEELVQDTQTWVCTLHHGGHKDCVEEVEGGNHEEVGQVDSIQAEVLDSDHIVEVVEEEDGIHVQHGGAHHTALYCS